MTPLEICSCVYSRIASCQIEPLSGFGFSLKSGFPARPHALCVPIYQFIHFLCLATAKFTTRAALIKLPCMNKGVPETAL